MIRLIVFVLVAVSLLVYLMNQVRKPTRWVGRFFAWRMNQSHSGLTDWGLEHVVIEPAATILDVGCGGGRTVQKLAALAPHGQVVGVDYAAGSVEQSRVTNAALIQAGRVEVRQASVSRLPFADASFDLVTAVETHYYWPDLPGDLREILRVLKPGGTAIAIAEDYRGGRLQMFQGPAMAFLRGRVMSADEHRGWFGAAGFVDVRVSEEPDEGWICVTGRRPAEGGA
jgi:SAM-dependent methyltransferase